MAAWAKDARVAWPPSSSPGLDHAAVVEAAAGAWRGGELLEGFRTLYVHDLDVSCGTAADKLECDQVPSRAGDTLDTASVIPYKEKGITMLPESPELGLTFRMCKQ